MTGSYSPGSHTAVTSVYTVPSYMQNSLKNAFK